MYVTDNPNVKAGLTASNVVWAFTTITASNWHPLTWLSHMVDVEIFGLNAGGHHITSIIIHAASTLLLFLILAKITAGPWQSFFVAALFGLHPLHVESVAWVAERKDVLSCFLGLLTLFLYAGYVQRPGSRRYVFTLLSFVAGVMAKPMLVTFPFVMLLLDYWPFDRLRREGVAHGVCNSFAKCLPVQDLLKEKAPFFLVSGISAVVTVLAQRSGGTVSSLEVVPLTIRVANALIAYVMYIEKAIWPQDLAILYPFNLALPLWKVVASLLLLASIIAGTVFLRRRAPYLLVGWLWYLVTLLPVIGIVQVGSQSIADRYTYIPLTGIFIMVAWGAPALMRGLRYYSAVVVLLSCLVLAALVIKTWQQLGYWKDNIVLYRHTLDVTENNYLILNNLGILLADRGDISGAIQAYQQALRISPRSVLAHTNLGVILADQGRLEEAISHYQEALHFKPDYALARINLSKALNNMGVAWAQRGGFDEAVGYFKETIRMDPESVDGHFNLGITLARLNRVDEATEEFFHVLRLTPDSAEARSWLRRLGR